MGSPDIEDDVETAGAALDQEALSSGAGELTGSAGPRKKMQCQVGFVTLLL
jgi:hypothetical protein